MPAERVTVTGNLKYETPEPPSTPEVDAAIRSLAGGRPVLVAGSTMKEGTQVEEEAVLAAFRAADGGERALLVLAPRHPERWDDAAERLAASGLAWVRRSALAPAEDQAEDPAEDGARVDVLLLDSLGELASLYRLAAGAFIGGTLVPTGGHNPLEAARWGVPVAVGPSMENFRQMADDFDRREAWARAAGAEALGEVFRALARRPGGGPGAGRAGPGAGGVEPWRPRPHPGAARAAAGASGGGVVTLPPSPPPPRSPWQLVYGAALGAWRRGWKGKAGRLPRPVISVGNLSWGGSGKTPVTAAIARHLADRPGGGRRVAVLSRGYGREETPEREVLVVSTGDGPLLGPSVAGDEPVLLAGELPGVAVVVAGSRYAAGRHALAHLDPPPDLFVLDDGFSHLPLERDLDLLVFPAADPFAGGGRWAAPGRLAPFGRLREPLAAARRADAVLLTGDPETIGDATGDDLARALAPHGYRGPGFTAPARLGPIRWTGGRSRRTHPRARPPGLRHRPPGVVLPRRRPGRRGARSDSRHRRAALPRSPPVPGREPGTDPPRRRRAGRPGGAHHRQGPGEAPRPPGAAAGGAAPDGGAGAGLPPLARRAAGRPARQARRAVTALRHRIEYAAYALVRALVRLLPHAGARVVGRGLGRLLHAVMGKHRRIVRENLALALPEIPVEERRRMVPKVFEHLGLSLADALSVERFDLEGLCRRIDLEGWEHLQEAERRAKERGTGLFILSAHLGLWEVAAYPPGIYGGPLHVIGRPLDNPLLDRELVRSRARFGNELIPKRGAVRPMVKTLARGGRVGILIDQRARPGEGIWVPFFGVPAYTTPILARIALRTGAPVVPIFGHPLPDGRYRVVLREPLWPDGPERPDEAPEGVSEDEAVAALTRRYLEACEAEIRRHPETWLWLHERWKTPKGETRPEG